MNHFHAARLLIPNQLILPIVENKLQKQRSLILIEVLFMNLCMNDRLHTWKICLSSSLMKNNSSSDNNRISFKSSVIT